MSCFISRFTAVAISLGLTIASPQPVFAQIDRRVSCFAHYHETDYRVDVGLNGRAEPLVGQLAPPPQVSAPTALFF